MSDLDRHRELVDAFHGLMGQFELHLASVQTCGTGHRYLANSPEYPCPLCTRDQMISTLVVKLRTIQEACKILESTRLNDLLVAQPAQSNPAETIPQLVPPKHKPAPPTGFEHTIL